MLPKDTTGYFFKDGQFIILSCFSISTVPLTWDYFNITILIIQCYNKKQLLSIWTRCYPAVIFYYHLSGDVLSMNSYRTVFSQIFDFIPKHQFRACVNRYNGNYRVKSFSCFDQYLTMAFAQLTYRESLRDIEICLRALDDKLYRCGFRGKISRNNLANSNEKRD